MKQLCARADKDMCVSSRLSKMLVFLHKPIGAAQRHPLESVEILRDPKGTRTDKDHESFGNRFVGS